MGFKSDIEIAQECEMKPITEIAAKAGIEDKYLEQYGKYKAKIDYNLLKETDKKDGSRRATITFLPSFCIASARPTVVVVFPSPAGVGLIAVTRISLPSFLSVSFRRL